MPNYLPPKSAGISGQILFVVIPFLVWLLSRLLKSDDKPATPPAGSGGAGSGRSAANLEALAARRRAELEALARRRAQVNSQAAADPMRQRAMARALSEQRAALLRAQTSPGVIAPSRPQVGAPPMPSAVPGLVSRRAGEQVEARARYQIDRPAARPAARPASSARAATAAQATVAPLRRAPVPVMDSSDAEQDQALPTPAEATDIPTIPDRAQPAGPPTVTFAGKNTVKLTPRTLQAALVVSELLAPPVCMRDPAHHPYAIGTI
jgi:hypothetical protein